MKLGISYNLFDGEELLEGSISCIRESVDYISVVYQTISNFGNPCNNELLPLLEKLKKNNLVDEIYQYVPTIIGGKNNELIKRNIGLELSKNARCSHHMSMDCDEYYIASEFNNLKNLIIENNYDSSFCQMLSYYKTWEYILDPPETYYVSLIYKIKENVFYYKYRKNNHPVVTDPTRKMSTIINPIILDRTQIQMHHGSYIRKNIRNKFENSSVKINLTNDQIDSLVNHYENWQYPNQVLWFMGGKGASKFTVKKVNSLF
jgi:hypothetical protein